VAASPVIVACLLDHASVRGVLGPVAAELRGKTVVNVTTTTPTEARGLPAWAADRGTDDLDGAILATPTMIGGPGAMLLYGGDAAVFAARKELLATWGNSSFMGEDAGRASLWDLAMLAGMYQMFAGFVHGATMVGASAHRTIRQATVDAGVGLAPGRGRRREGPVG
jgi:3-hydroxyisobutyrate dehydrogenase-like beta-hydroxyacid dehydrogenase